ncbi:MAG: DUF2312 domain-containing protein [Magnetococcales bacterium]|nr:DUF2312 domain-containing protein [Magnetococcales bacterium]
MLRSSIEKIERLQRERASLEVDIHNAWHEAKKSFSEEALQRVIEDRRRNPEKKVRQDKRLETIFPAYMQALKTGNIT